MGDLINVLHVDDEPSLTELTATFLERQDDRFTVETATSAEDALTALNDRPPDCVVSDYNMPGMDGLEFLRAVREDYPDLPFILFTGKGSEAVASDAIAADVTNYLQKGSGSEQYELLANRILNAVRARNEAKRADRQEQLMRLTEFAGDTGGWELDRDGETVLLTAGTRRIIGRPDQSEIPLEEAIELFHPDEREDVRQTLKQAFRTGEELNRTLRLQPGDGDERFIDMTITPVVENGVVTKLRGVGHDITERKERQRRLTQIETSFQHTQDSLVLIDADEEFTVERVNPAWEDAMGLSAEHVRGRTPRDILGEQHGTTAEARYRECVQRREPLQYEETARIEGERTYWVTKIAPVTVDGTVEYVVGSTRNVTEKKERQQELEEYETIIEALTDAVYVLDEEGRFTYVNDEFVELVGYDRETIIGNAPSLIKDDGAVEQAEGELGRLLSSTGPETVSFEVTIHPRDGDPIVCEDHMGVLPYEGDEFDGSVGVLRDITGRKERERELKRTHDLVTNMEQLADTGAWEYESGSESLTITDGTRRLYGLDPDAELTLDDAFEAVHPADRDALADRFDTCLETGESYEIDVRLTTDEGAQRWITARGERVDERESGNVVRGYIRDITERKRLERDLKQERDLLTGIVETVPVGISVVDADGSISFVNEQLESISGRSLEELKETEYDHSRYGLVNEHGEPLGAGEAPFDHVMSRETAVYDQVVGFRRQSGERVWVSVSGAPQYDDDGELERTVFAFKDITERREAEAQLAETLKE